MNLRIPALVATTALVGFLVGVRAAGEDAPAKDAPVGAERPERPPLGGSFWRPPHSDSTRPTLRLEPVRFQPHAPEPEPRGATADADEERAPSD